MFPNDLSSDEELMDGPMYVGLHDAINDAQCIGDNLAMNTQVDDDVGAYFYILKYTNSKERIPKTPKDTWEM